MQTYMEGEGEEGGEEWRVLPSPCFAKKKIQLKPKITFGKSTSRLRRVKITENIFPSMLEGEGRGGELFILRGAARTLFVKQTRKRSESNI